MRKRDVSDRNILDTVLGTVLDPNSSEEPGGDITASFWFVFEVSPLFAFVRLLRLMSFPLGVVCVHTQNICFYRGLLTAADDPVTGVTGVLRAARLTSLL